MFKQKKSQVLLFLGSVVIFLSFFFLVKKNVGSGLILGSVGLRQYNNFFFALVENGYADVRLRTVTVFAPQV